MNTVEITDVQDALADFIDQRVLSEIGDSSVAKWMFGGASALLLTKLESMVDDYAPVLKSMGILTEDKEIDLGATEVFINSAFDKQEVVKMPLFGITFSFDKSDGDALITALKRRSN